MLQRVVALCLVATAIGAACTTILGNDFEVSETISSGGSVGQGGNGGAAGGVGATGGGGGGGIDTGDEDCTNGSDDDADGAIDCEDSDCSPFVCIAEIPPTWNGPIALADVPFGDALPTCPAAFGNEIHNGVEGVIGDPVTCNACLCNADVASCAPAPIAIYGEVNCGGMFPLAESNIIGGCDPMTSIGGQPTMRIGTPAASVTCTQGGGGVGTTPAPRWSTASRSCAYTADLGAGCPGTDICVLDDGGAAGGDRKCILKAGDNVCPDPYSDRIVYSDDLADVTDTRDCSTCACEQATASCSLTTRFYSNSNCTGSATFTVANNGVCNNSNPNGLHARASLDGAATGTCQVQTPAAPQGGVTADGPFTTVCCLP